MGWFERIESHTNTPAVRPGLPRKVLHHLIVKHDLAVGSRILDIGCGRGELVRFLDQLGFDATGIDESPDNIDAALRAAPSLDFRCGRADQIAPDHEGAFNLVLIRDFEAYRENLFSLAAFGTTANLLSCTDPGGLLVFLVRDDPLSPATTRRHHVACYTKHLLQFPGHCETAGLPDGLDHVQTWRSLLVARARSRFVTVTFRLPGEPSGRSGWLRLADHAAAAHHQPCCRPLAELHPEPAGAKSAA